MPLQRSLYLGSTRLALKFGMEVTAAGVAIAVHALYSSMVGKIRESNAFFFFFLTLVPDALQHYASLVALVGFRRKAPTAAMDSAAAVCLWLRLLQYTLGARFCPVRASCGASW